MVPMNVKDYVKIYDDFIDQDLCKQALDELKTSEWRLHSYYSVETNSYYQSDKELSVCFPLLNNLNDPTRKIHDKIWYAIDRYIKDFNFEWFGSWSGYNRIRINRYGVNTKMNLHCDHIKDLFDGNIKGVPTLSILGALNDDYEGGDFIMWESEKITLKAGSIMVFPSNFLFPHRVDEVTKGTRYTFVSWAW